MDEDDSYERLDPAVVRLWRIQTVITMLVIALAALIPVGILTILGKIASIVPLALIVTGIGVVSMAVLWFVGVSYRRWSFCIQDNGIVLIRNGVVFTREIHVPMGRVQHVDIEQGPLERRFELVRLILFTAGSKDARQVIPGLRHAVAESLRTKLTRIANQQHRDA